jgi:polyadenylate-binding protein
LSGSLNVPLQYDSLAALSPVVRKEVLSGELTRRIKNIDAVSYDEVDGIVESIVTLSLSEVVSVLQDPSKLLDHVHASGAGSKSSPAKSSSPAPSQDSRLLDPATNAATASAPEHPSTPISVPSSTPPRTSSPSGSLAPTSEKERMNTAISKLEKLHIPELTDLLMSLPKRDRALCLFNTEVLRAKIADAKVVLESESSEDVVEQLPVVPVTPQVRKVSQSTAMSSPHTPDLSSRGPSATASPAPQTPGAPPSEYTISSLAQMSFAEVHGLVTSGADLPLLKTTSELFKESEQWVGTVSSHTLATFKEQVGRKWCVIFDFVYGKT